MKKEMGRERRHGTTCGSRTSSALEHHRFEGRSLAEVAELMGLEVVDAICELLREDQQVSYVSAGANMATMPRSSHRCTWSVRRRP